MIRAADTYLKVANDQTKVVVGHGPLASKADVAEFRDMLITSRDRIKKLFDEGQDRGRSAGAQSARRSQREMGGGKSEPRRRSHAQRLPLVRAILDQPKGQKFGEPCKEGPFF